MIVLAIDTCFNRCAACLFDSRTARVMAEESLVMERGHAEALAPLVQRLLAQAGISAAELGRVAVTTGPGTFTGLRIGLSFARALGLARGIPVMGLDSLNATALPLRAQPGPWLIAHKAGQSGFHFVLRHTPEAQPEIIKTEALRAELADWQGLLLGTGADDLMALDHNPKITRHAAWDLPPLGRLAAWAATAPPPEAMPAPVYLRDADAKPQAPAKPPIRLAAAEDAPALALLHQQCFEQGWTASDLAAMLAVAGTRAMLFEVNGKAVGFILLRAVLDEAEIITLAVAPQLRHRGVGKALLQEAQSALRQQAVTRLFLEVNESNAAALALYLGSGFAETGRRRAYYQTAQGRKDAILMAQSLP